jgi:predicted enzyme related to lactoylglutathione lyase
MDAYKTHGAFSWNELMTTDPERRRPLLRRLFGWTVKNMDMGTGPYHVAKRRRHAGRRHHGHAARRAADAAGTGAATSRWTTSTRRWRKCTALGGKC